MKYRKRVSRSGSKRLFTATALKVNYQNGPITPRGGLRL